MIQYFAGFSNILLKKCKGFFRIGFKHSQTNSEKSKGSIEHLLKIVYKNKWTSINFSTDFEFKIVK